MDLQIKPLALATAMASLSSFSIAETAPASSNETVQPETVVNAEEAPSATMENTTEIPIESAGDPLSVQVTEAQAASLDFSTFNVFKQSLSAVLTEVLPEETFVMVSEGLQLISLEPEPEVDTDTRATTPSDVSLDVNQLFDGFFEAQEAEGFSALSYKKELLLNLGTVYGFEVSFSVKATEVIADDKVIPEKEESGFGTVGVIAGLAGAGLAAGGGGGGSSSSSDNGTYRNTIEGAYGTEYTANVGLADHNILSLNDYGYTGNGIKVGVVDSGIDATHQEFDGKTIYGTDFASSPTDYNRDENGHGTHVASIIAGDRDQSGIRGMAYDATLYSYKVDNDGDSDLEGLSSDAAIANIFNRHVTDGIKVSNNSWGGSTAITSTTEGAIRAAYSQTMTAMRSVQTNGGVIVFAAGNDGRAQPDSWGGAPYLITELVNEWLVVVAVDADGVEPSYTNRCGVAKAFCVTALGGGDTQSTEGVYAADAGTTSGYTRLSGTSMATPHVSGLVAALREKFPSLTAAQVVTRVKDGASLSGLTGSGGQTTSNSSTAVMEAICGHGLINATASASVMGTLVYPTGDSLSDGSVTNVSLPSGLSSATVNKIMNTEFVAFDSFDGARFYVSGSKIFKGQDSGAMPRFGQAPQYSEISSANLSLADQSGTHMYAISDGSASVINGSSSFWGNKANLFTNGLSPSAVNVSQVEWMFGGDKIAMHPFVKTSGDGSIFGSGVSVRYSPLESFSAFAGLSNEQTTLSLGTTQTSASSVSNRSVETGFSLSLSEQWSAFGRVVFDNYETIEATPKSLGISDARSTGATFGLHWGGSSTDVAFGVYQPNTLSDGVLVMVTPAGRTQSDDIIWAKKTLDIDSSSSVYPLFLAFNRNFGNSTEVGFSVKESELYQGQLGGAELSVSYAF